MNVCRLCLQGSGPLHSIVESGLRPTLEKITQVVLNESDGYPQVVCLVCRAYLNKCNKLIQMSLKSEQLLKEIITKQLPSTALRLKASDRLCSLVKSLPETVSYQAGCIDVPIKDEFEEIYYRPIKTECVNYYDSEFDFDDGNKAKNTEEISSFQVQTEDSAREEYNQQTSLIEVKTENSAREEYIHQISLFQVKAEDNVIEECYQHEEGVVPMCGDSEGKTGNYVCEYCTQEFQLDEQLQRHIIDSHTIKKHDLNKKTKETKLREMKEHVKCLDEDSNDEYILETNSTKIYGTCKTCNKSIDTNVNRPVRTYRGKKSLEAVPETNIATKNDSAGKLVDESFKCLSCNLRASGADSLLTNDMKMHEEKLLKCAKCAAEFTGLISLQNHMRIHTEEKSFKCRLCHSSFEEIYLLYSHMKVHGESVFECAICDKQFNSSKHLEIHMRAHAGAKPYKCDVCSYGFSTKWHLKCHMKRHSGERPHSCNVCGRSFSFIYHLIEHMTIHTGEKAYKCDKCGRRFGRPGCLRRHMATHDSKRPFICDICKKGYKQKISLARHIPTHDSSIPLKCKHCDKSYSYIASLKKHERIHEKLAPPAPVDCGGATVA